MVQIYLSRLCAQRFALLGAGAGVDSAWEQRKLEARKMLENATDPQRPVHALLGVDCDSFNWV